MKRYCIFCKEELAEAKLGEKINFCNNPKCPRIGLLTVLFFKKDDKKNKHKKLQQKDV